MEPNRVAVRPGRGHAVPRREDSTAPLQVRKANSSADWAGCSRALLVGLGTEVLAVHSSDTECQVKGLATVEPGIACGLVSVWQVAFRDVLPAAYAFGDVVAGELDMDATRVRAERAVHLEKPGDLIQHVIEVSCLVAAGHLNRVAVHRVACPHDLGPAGRDCLHQRRQRLAYPARAHP